MKNFVIINGVNSNTINGLGINELPPISKPSMRVLTEEIDGRDGDITTNLGYSAYDKTITIGLFGTGYDINNIISFFNGEGTITFSNEDDKYYKYKIINQIDYEALLKFKQATITFHCQPFKYPLTETPLEIEYDYIEQTGETLTLNNTGESILKLDPRGQCKQDGEPSPDFPQQIHEVSGDNEINVCGKNLYSRENGQYNVPIYATDGTSASYQDVNVVWVKVKPNTDYSFTLLPNSQTYFVRIIECTGDKGFIYRFPNNYQPGSGVANTLTITTPNNCEWLQIGINQYQTSQISQNNWEIMIEESSTPTIYEPYNCDKYSINLGVENLFNKTSNIVNNKYIGADGSIQDEALNWYQDDYIEVKPSTDYIMSSNSSKTVRVALYDSSKTFISRTYSTGSVQVTTTSSTKYVRLSGYNNANDNVQLEIGSKANSYSPFGQTPIKMRGIGTYEDYFVRNSGKNILDFDAFLNYSNVTYTKNNNIYNITNRGDIISNRYPLNLKPNTTYTLSCKEINNSSSTLRVQIYEDSTYICRVLASGSSEKSVTFTTNDSSSYYMNMTNSGDTTYPILWKQVMLEEGYVVSTYEPYGTGKWCKYNAIGNVVLDGSEEYSLSAGNKLTLLKNIGLIAVGINNTGYLYCDNYKEVANNDSDNTNYNISRFYATSTYNYEKIVFRNVDISTANDFKTWLSTHNTQVDYVLATPYLSLIEDETLISQLDNIQNAMSYEGQTNVSQVNNDKPFIISAKALEKGSDEVVVNNIGNIYAKPLLALEGNGIVNIYLNNNQVLQANVEDKMNIDIDTLEAYNPDTSVLLNRQVIGNYNSMTIPSGESIIKIDGALDKATISNYTRWL